MKQTKYRRFVDAHPTANPLPVLKSIKEILDVMKEVQANLPSCTGWTLIGPDGKVWTGPDPLALAAQANPLKLDDYR